MLAEFERYIYMTDDVELGLAKKDDYRRWNPDHWHKALDLAPFLDDGYWARFGNRFHAEESAQT